MNSTLVGLGWISASVVLTGCGGEAPPEPVPTTPTPGIFRVADVDNTGNGSDLFVSVVPAANEELVVEYRVFAVPQSGVASFDAAAAAALGADRYTVVNTGATSGTVDITLGAAASDADGDPVEEGVPYRVFAFAVPASGEASNESLSQQSNQITLARTNLVRTLTDEIQAGSGGMAVDADGNIYAADFGAALSGTPGTVVYKITPDGTVSVFANGIAGASGNAFDSQGNLFQSNIAGNRISRISPNGSVTTFVTEGISNPVGIAIDEDDNLFVANCGNNTIRRVTTLAESTQFASGGLFSCPNGIALASDGNLYVANFGNGSVVQVTPNGSTSIFATIPGGNNGHITFANGVLYVVARSAHQIYELQLDGTLNRLAGSGTRGLWDGAALSARLSLTNDIAVSPDGSILYFNDVVNQTGTDILSPILIRMVILDPAP